MFTVLINYIDRAELYPAERAIRIYKSKNGMDPGLVLYTKDEDNLHFGEAHTDQEVREVFVMNEAGQTVARYSL